MDVVCKGEDDDMEGAAVGGSLDEWPPPDGSPSVDVSDDNRKDNNSSRLLFLVEYVGEPENAPFTNSGDQFICDLDPQVVNPLDPNMGCVACYSPVEYSIANNTNSNSRSGSPFQSSIDEANINISSSGDITDTSTTITTTNVSLMDSNCSGATGLEDNISASNLGNNASNNDNSNGFSVTTAQPMASPLSAPPGTPSSPLSALTQSPIHNDDDPPSILIIENQFSLSSLDQVQDNFIMTTASSDLQNNCGTDLTQAISSSITSATCSVNGSDDCISSSELALKSTTDDLLLAADSVSQESQLVMDETGSKEESVGSGRQIELLLENGVALGFVDQESRVIQIPREYLMAAKLPPFDSTLNDDAYSRNLYNAFKSQGLLVDGPNDENGEIRLVSFLDTDTVNGMDNLINEAVVVDQSEVNSADLTPSLPPTTISESKEITLKDFSNHDWISGYESKTKWCQECSSTLEGDCSMHRVNSIISDKPVPSRARATLPASYLAINWLTSMDSPAPVYGVFARKTIPNRTQFGPIEGVVLKCEDLGVIAETPINFLVESESGDMRCLDVSNENFSNWMRFVRPAKNVKEQNLILSQQGHSLYFTSIRTIHPRQELLVWYSPAYAAKRNLRTLEPDKNKDETTIWPCFECEEKFKSSEELQKHLNTHDVERDDKTDGVKTRSKKQAHPALRRKAQSYPPPVKKYKLNDIKAIQEKNQSFECTSCKRTFPRMYSLKRHLQLHNTDKRYPCPHCFFVFPHPYNRDRHVRKQHSHKITTNTKVVPAGNEQQESVEAKVGTGWLCKHCKLTFPSASVLNLHTLAHAAENLECEIVTGLPSDFPNMYHAGEFLIENGDIQCPQCTQVFQKKRDLVDHVATHGQKTITTEQQPLKEIHESNSEMITRSVTQNQQKFVNDKRNNKTINNTDEYKKNGSNADETKPLQCSDCQKRFLSSSAFACHLKTNNCRSADEIKSHQCNVCRKRFLSSAALSCHVKTHNSRVFECPICKMKFEQVLALKAHVHSHSLNGLFTCPHCRKEFEEYSLIRKHIRAFHCDHKFVCAYCAKLFHTQDKLRMHMLRHSDHREFLCADCGKQFKRKDKLKEHMKRMHSNDREQKSPPKPARPSSAKKFVQKVVSTSDYERFIFKCHTCLLGFKRRGMLVNHLANRHPDITPESVPELNLPILKTTRDYYCQYCEKIYKSSSKRKAHILKNHPGAELPMSNRQKGGVPDIPGLPNPTFSQTVGSITTTPHGCQWCHKQYASKAKLLQHQRKKHLNLLPSSQQQPRPGKNMASMTEIGSINNNNNNNNNNHNRIMIQSNVSNNKDLTSVIGLNGNMPNSPEQCIPNAEVTGKSVLTQSNRYNLPSIVNNSNGIINVSSINAENSPAIVSSNNLPITTTAGSITTSTKSGTSAVAGLPQGQLFTLHPIHPLSNHQGVIPDNYLSEYEIATGDTDFTEGGIIIDAATIKRELKNENVDSLQGELLMSELGCTLSDIRSLSQDQQYLKLIQMPAGIVISDALNDPFYTPYTAR